MNAVIALCHFCEVHGPQSIFCTQTLRDTKLEDLEIDQHQQLTMDKCAACISIGLTNGIYSKDGESGATFLSVQMSMMPEVLTLIKQAAVRSLSCEINCTKDGGFVYFGDSQRGHVLSHTFYVSDLQARGFSQLFSIVVLMKDKYFLLNTKPFLAEHLRRISNEIQSSALKIRKNEEEKGSPRQRRMSQAVVQTPRSLIELTGDDLMFATLHCHFSWILLAGSRFLTEHVTFGNLPWLPPQSTDRPPQQRLSYHINTLPMIQKYEQTLDDPEQAEFNSLRQIQHIMGRDFTSVCYCALTGVKVVVVDYRMMLTGYTGQIIVRGAPDRTFTFMLCLKKLLPDRMHNLMRIDAQHQHSISSDYKILSVSNEIAVPMASSCVFRIDFLNEAVDGHDVLVKWPGELPNKLPDLLTKLLKAVAKDFTELVLNKHTKALVEEWKNKVICLGRAKSCSAAQTKLKKVLGVQAHDQPIVNYWSSHLQ